jgi:hypothetical protein
LLHGFAGLRGRGTPERPTERGLPPQRPARRWAGQGRGAVHHHARGHAPGAHDLRRGRRGRVGARGVADEARECRLRRHVRRHALRPRFGGVQAMSQTRRTRGRAPQTRERLVDVSSAIWSGG